jgi:hypothetical protein
VVVVDRGGAGDFLAIRDPRSADVGLHFVDALQDIDLDVQVQFVHAREDGLTGHLVSRDAEPGVLGG